MDQQLLKDSLLAYLQPRRPMVNELEKPLDGTIIALGNARLGDPQRQAVIQLDAVEGGCKYVVVHRMDVPSLNDLPPLVKGQRLRILKAQKSGDGFLVIEVSAL